VPVVPVVFLDPPPAAAPTAIAAAPMPTATPPVIPPAAAPAALVPAAAAPGTGTGPGTAGGNVICGKVPNVPAGTAAIDVASVVNDGTTAVDPAPNVAVPAPLVTLTRPCVTAKYPGFTICTMKSVPRIPMVATGVASLKLSRLRLESAPVNARKPPRSMEKSALIVEGDFSLYSYLSIKNAVF